MAEALTIPKIEDEEINRLHNDLLYKTLAINHLSHLSHRVNDKINLERFTAECRNYLTAPVDRDGNCRELLEKLVEKGHIKVGCYDVLKQLVSFSAPLKREVEDVERAINMKRKRIGLNRNEPNKREETLRIEELVMRIDFCDLVPMENDQYQHVTRQMSRLNRTLIENAYEITNDPELFREYTDTCDIYTETLAESSGLLRLFFYLEDEVAAAEQGSTILRYAEDANEMIRQNTRQFNICQENWKNHNRLLKNHIILLTRLSNRGAFIRKLLFGSILLFLSFESIEKMEKLITEYKIGALQKEVQEILITEDFLKYFALNAAKIEISIDQEESFRYLDQQIYHEAQTGEDPPINIKMHRRDRPTDEPKRKLFKKPRVSSDVQSATPGPHNVAGSSRAVIDAERRIILIGKIGAGKSQSGNAILGYKYNEVFKAKKALKSETSEVMYGTSVMNGKRYRVYDTPGALNPDDKELFSEQLSKCIYCTSPGFHCLTVVISVAERPNKEDLQLFKNLKKYLGDSFQEHAVIIFTKVEDKAELDDILAPADCPEINELIRSCGQRYVCFGEDRKGVKQEFVDQYHEMLEEVIKNNVRHKMDFYKHPLYDKAQDFIAKDAKEIRNKSSSISENQALELARERAINGESDFDTDMRKEIKRVCPCTIL